MNTPETPIENLRTLVPKAGETRDTGAQAGSGGGGEFRYVEVPKKPVTTGARNLRIGLVLVAVALVLLAVGHLISGARALVPVITGLLAFTLLWALARLRVLRQQNGVFLALAAVVVLGAAIALGERGYVALRKAIQENANPSMPATVSTAAPTPAPVAEPEPPLLSKELRVKPPESAGPRVKITDDARVLVGRKPYLIKAGEVFALEKIEGEEAIILANDLRISLGRDKVQLLDEPAKPPLPPAAVADETPAQVTKRAQEEAVRRYPALGIKDSPENQLFVDTYRELKLSGSALLKDPEWPLHLANSIAKREGWKAEGEPETPIAPAEKPITPPEPQ